MVIYFRRPYTGSGLNSYLYLGGDRSFGLFFRRRCGEGERLRFPPELLVGCDDAFLGGLREGRAVLVRARRRVVGLTGWWRRGVLAAALALLVPAFEVR